MLKHMLGRWVKYDPLHRYLVCAKGVPFLRDLVIMSLVFYVGYLSALENPHVNEYALCFTLLMMAPWKMLYCAKCKRYDIFPDNLIFRWWDPSEREFTVESNEAAVDLCYRVIREHMNTFTSNRVLWFKRSNVWVGESDSVNRLHYSTGDSGEVGGFYTRNLDLAVATRYKSDAEFVKVLLHEMVHRYTDDEGICTYLTFCLAGYIDVAVQYCALSRVFAYSSDNPYGSARKYFTPGQVEVIKDLYCVQQEINIEDNEVAT